MVLARINDTGVDLHDGRKLITQNYVKFIL